MILEQDEAMLARARARAKSAWSASKHDDDLTTRAASEERLMAAWPRPRVRPARAFALGATAAACVALVAFATHRVRGGGSVGVVTSAATSAPSWRPNPAGAGGTGAASGSISVAALPNDAPSPGVASPLASPATHGIVLTGACPECRVGGAAFEPGAAVGAGDNLSVPRGARVTLAFALRIAGAPMIDPAVGIDLEGPAVASAPDDHTISLAIGTARFRGIREVALTVPGGRVVGEGATFTVRIDGRGVARIAVEQGHVVVTSRHSDETQALDAGGVIEIGGIEPTLPAAAPTAPHVAAPRDITSSAATTPSAAPTEPVGDVAATRRASFRRAEIEMASADRSEHERGRARLAELSVCPDVKLASDAATLLARSDAIPAARAETWARFLATSPPAPYRNRALLERAEALLDAGRAAEANAILAELHSAPLPAAQKRQLDRLIFKARDPR